jgi:hypothetical protein
MKNSTSHEYRLHQYVLYEFTEHLIEEEGLVERKAFMTGTEGAVDDESRGHHRSETNSTDSELGEVVQTVNGSEVLYSLKTKVGQFVSETFQSLRRLPASCSEDEGEMAEPGASSEASAEEVIPDIYDRESEEGSSSGETISVEGSGGPIAGRKMILTAAIPLVDIRIQGPEAESTSFRGEKTFSLTLNRKSVAGNSGVRSNDPPLDFIKRDDLSSLQSLQHNRLRLSSRESVKLLFTDQITAQNWKIYLAESSLSSRTLPTPTTSGGPPLSLASSSSQLVAISSLSQRITAVGNAIESGAEYRSLPNGRQLIIPSAGAAIEDTEAFKIKIAKKMLSRS